MLNKDLWLGLAITTPFGLKLDYASDWFGRYDSIDNKPDSGAGRQPLGGRASLYFSSKLYPMKRDCS